MYVLLSAIPTATDVQKVVYSPGVLKSLTSFHTSEELPEGTPCKTEIETFFICLGEDFTNCFIDIIVDLVEAGVDTCDELKASDFCTDLLTCAASVTNDCTSEGEALEECADEQAGDSDEEACDVDCDEKVDFLRIN